MRKNVAFNAKTIPFIADSINTLGTPEGYQTALKSAAGFITELQKSYSDENFVPEGQFDLSKATFSQASGPTTGLTYYDLEMGAKFLYPVLTPLRNEIPRVSAKGGTQANWRAVTGINTTGLRIGVSGGNRGAVQAVATKDYLAAYKGIGLETTVDFEAQYAGAGFDDVKAIGAKTGLEATMIGEELLLLGGNTSVALGTTPTPTLAAVNGPGALADGTYSVICVALSLDAVVNGSVVNGVQGSITRTNADGSSDTFGGGASGRSLNATVTVAGGSGTGSINAICNPAGPGVRGACGYAWFWGAAGSEVLGAITSINSYVITAAATGTQTAASLGANDNSTNNLVFDGLLYQAFAPGSGAYVKFMASGVAGVGSTLTGDGAGGVVEIDALLKDRWDNYRLSPDTMWVSSQEAQNISRKIMTGNANSMQRFVFNSTQEALSGGVMISTYNNKFSMAGAKTLQIRIHPNMPQGTILFTTNKLPYPLNGVNNIIQVRTRQDYYQITWPLRARRWEMGVYADEVCQNFFPPSMCILTNIANG